MEGSVLCVVCNCCCWIQETELVVAMKRELTWTHLQLRQKVNNIWYKLQDGDNNDDILCCRKNNFKQVTP